MSDSLQTAAIEIAQKAFEDFTVEKDIAQYIKKEFDRCVGLLLVQSASMSWLARRIERQTRLHARAPCVARLASGTDIAVMLWTLMLMLLSSLHDSQVRRACLLNDASRLDHEPDR